MNFWKKIFFNCTFYGFVFGFSSQISGVVLNNKNSQITQKKQESQSDFLKYFDSVIDFIDEDTNEVFLDKNKIKYDLQMLEGAYFLLSDQNKKTKQTIYEKNLINLTKVLKILNSGIKVSSYFFYKFIDVNYQEKVNVEINFKKILMIQEKYGKEIEDLSLEIDKNKSFDEKITAKIFDLEEKIKYEILGIKKNSRSKRVSPAKWGLNL